MSTTASKSKGFIIPARPESLINITEELRSPEPDSSVICTQIKKDVALFSSVISTVNSAYYGLGQNVTSVERAVSLLGVKRIFTIVQLAALKNSLSTVGPLERFWDTATEVATICTILAKKFSNLNSDDVYTLGMLHDSGVPLLMQAKPEYKDFLRNLNSCNLTQIHQSELDHYGISHYHLSAKLAEKWNIEKSTIEAIKHQPDHETILTEPADDKEHMRLKLCLLILARDISDIYRHFWRIPDQPSSSINITPALNFLGVSDFDYLDIKEDILHSLTQQE
jgi:HD-like signal output (HDOD) protein